MRMKTAIRFLRRNAWKLAQAHTKQIEGRKLLKQERKCINTILKEA